MLNQKTRGEAKPTDAAMTPYSLMARLMDVASAMNPKTSGERSIATAQYRLTTDSVRPRCPGVLFSDARVGYKARRQPKVTPVRVIKQMTTARVGPAKVMPTAKDPG